MFFLLSLIPVEFQKCLLSRKSVGLFCIHFCVNMISTNSEHSGLSPRRFLCCVVYLKPLMLSVQRSELSDPPTVCGLLVRPLGRPGLLPSLSDLLDRTVNLITASPTLSEGSDLNYHL